MSLSRRDLLLRAGAGAGAIALAGDPLAAVAEARRRGLVLPRGFDFPVAPRLKLPFAHGVASGDPLADRVILWTRLTIPEPERVPSVRVQWRVATDRAMRHVVERGSVRTDASRDWTVKVDPSGLRPATTYFYDFRALGVRSKVGRTRTAPAGAADRLRMAVVACSSYWSGHFNAYARLAERDDLDLVVHCGDHVYDYPDEHEWVRARRDRFDPGYVDFRDWRTLGEIRRRYALYYADPDFVALHAAHPISIVWDNHDLDTAEGMGIEDPLRAFWEWTPTRPPRGDGSGEFGAPQRGQVTPEDPGLVYRALPYGDLADVLLIDTRHIGRDERTAANFRTRRLLGERQFAWLSERSLASKREGVAWRVVANQVLMGQLRFTNLPRGVPAPPFEELEAQEGFVFNPVQWDGYPRERDLVLGFWRDQGIRDNLVVTGDMHGSFVYDLVEDPSPPAYEPATGGGLRGSAGVEFAPSSVGRGGADETVMAEAYRARYGGDPAQDREGYEQFRAAGVAGSRALESAFRANTPNLRYMEWVEHGYGIVDLTPERALLELWWQPLEARSREDRLGAQLRVDRGTNHAVPVLRPEPTGRTTRDATLAGVLSRS